MGHVHNGEQLEKSWYSLQDMLWFLKHFNSQNINLSIAYVLRLETNLHFGRIIFRAYSRNMN